MSFDWTSDALAKLRVLWLQGMASAPIAAQLGTTKNSAIAKARRLGLPGRPSPIHWRDGPRPRVPVRVTGPTLPSLSPPEEAPVLKLTPIKTAPKASPAPAKPIALPSGRMCCWPTWEHRDAAYWAAIRAGTVLECGAVRASVADVYCAEHKRDARGSRTT